MEDHFKNNAPNQAAYAVNEDEHGQSHFTRIGTTVQHKDGFGATTHLSATPVDGKIIHRYPKDVIEALKAGKFEPLGQEHDKEASQEYDR